jgi:hypothetical protein
VALVLAVVFGAQQSRRAATAPIPPPDADDGTEAGEAVVTRGDAGIGGARP